MAEITGEIIKLQDFIELDYTGRLSDGTIFDTTSEEVARKNNLFSEKMKYGPMVICVGEQQILPGLDAQLAGKEVGKECTITLAPEQAFGKRDVRRIKIVPLSTFREHKVEPYPGLQIDVDNEMGTVSRVSGGRVMVNFNHPLAGKEVIYEIKIFRKITEPAEQLKAYLNKTLMVPPEKMKVEVKEEKAAVELPFSLPPELLETLGKKLAELTKLKEVLFTNATNKQAIHPE